MAMAKLWENVKNFFSGDNDYGFIDYSALACKNIVQEKNIQDIDFKISTTGDFSDIADNHCAATLITNLSRLYYKRFNAGIKLDESLDLLVEKSPDSKKYYSEDIGDADKNHEANNKTSFKNLAESKYMSNKKLFEEVHKFVPNGPVLRIISKGKKFFRQLNLKLSSKFIRRKSKYIATIEANKPVALLLIDGVFNWHWVLGIGYLIDADGQFYYRIIDNHNRKNTSYYIENKGSLYLYGRSLELKN